jgi:hypothetical protein
MTAIVAVLNKHAVAIAADSAVTMGNTHKVVNSANKIFTLSKYHPIAVMTYNNAAFMGTPWDIIIKEYRRQLKDRSLETVKDYCDDFIEFLHSRNFFCDDKTQKRFIKFLLGKFYLLCLENICKENGFTTTDSISESQIEEKLKNYLKELESADKSTEFKSYDYEDFKRYAYEELEVYAREQNFENVELLCCSFFHYLTANPFLPIYTGLVFVGYGESEIYPSLYPIEISFGIDNRLKYRVNEKQISKISEHGSEATITPFAQTDVTQTIIRGINPSFLDIIYKVIDRSIASFSNDLTEILDSNQETKALSTAVKNIDQRGIIEDITKQINNEMFRIYSKPLIETVALLDKEDMANMAESFIALTSLVRRMQPGEETVGGPVDVAVISKGDGFIWINRKHYFKPELNASFFNNYFK